MIQDVLCFFGTDMECMGVSVSIRSQELVCNSPVLPRTHTIAPFGVLVLGPGLQPPGTLYLPAGLELNFFDSSVPPILTALEPPFSDILDYPETFTVSGYNLSPSPQGSETLLCKWNDETAVPGTYDRLTQIAGDDVSEVRGALCVCSPSLSEWGRLLLSGCSLCR
jgi:hypothetical protein